MYSIARETLERLDLAQAVETEVLRPRRAFPRSCLEHALASKLSDAAEYVAGLTSHGFEFSGTDEMQGMKAGRGLRPLSVLTLQERVVYQALAAEALRKIGTVARAFRDWDGFAAQPLVASEAPFIVSADVASFYQYVDHELVRSELVQQTGDATLSEALSDLLHGVMQRRFGLPQLYHGSDVLAELVIDVAERSLIRRGLRVWRLNDDFRLATDSWRESQRAIELLNKDVGALGLTLHEAKTHTQRRGTYESWLQASDAAWDEINQEVQVDLRAYDLYTGEPIEADGDDEVQEAQELEAAAARALEYWGDLPDAWDEDRPMRVFRRLLSRALGILTFLESTTGLGFAKGILDSEPQFAPAVSRYLTAAARTDPDAVADVMDEIVREEDLYLNGWQNLWLHGVLPSLGGLHPNLLAWAKANVEDTQPGLLRARAAWTLAMHGSISPDEIVSVYEQIAVAARGDAVAALALSVPRSDQRLVAVSQESPLNRWIVEWGADGGDA